jgi:undecaprenyl-diphosphatase
MGVPIGAFMPTWLVVIIEGIVEGITEFLPISSTGHLILTSSVLNFDGIAGIFEIFIQLGAVIALVLYYWKDISQQARTIRNPLTQQHWLSIIVAFLPAGLMGFLLADFIDTDEIRNRVVAIGLIVGGIMFLMIERLRDTSKEEPKSITEEPLSLKQAFLVGCWQVLALFPGMSRSGMSIVGARAIGIDRQRATEFSFYLSIPTLGIATLYSLFKNMNNISMTDLGYLVLGAVVSGIVAWFSIAWLLRYVANHNFIVFGYYRIIVGTLILLYVFFQT